MQYETEKNAKDQPGCCYNKAFLRSKRLDQRVLFSYKYSKWSKPIFKRLATRD